MVACELKNAHPRPARVTSGLRYYIPPLGRWTSRDPLDADEDINLYRGILNAPVMFFDPLGLKVEDVTPCGPEDWGAWQKFWWFGASWIDKKKGKCQCYAKQEGQRNCWVRYSKDCCMTLRWKVKANEALGSALKNKDCKR